ncbi:MAG TPA: hypothetical protein VLX91_01385 [Candidatus Acidoferrales bacterium]|nr:hypothetical protein [Candidatus Acidoferrales bacterium]
MIYQERLEKLKQLFREDGIEISDAAALEAGLWLIERVKAVCVPIPPEKEALYHEIAREIEPLWALYKNQKA